MEEIILTEVKKNYMKSYFLVERLYDIYNKFSDSEEGSRIEFKSLVVNLKTLDYIREINFVFLGNLDTLDKIKEVTKIGILLNFEVYLDPNLEENKIVFQDLEKKNSYELIIKD